MEASAPSPKLPHFLDVPPHAASFLDNRGGFTLYGVLGLVLHTLCLVCLGLREGLASSGIYRESYMYQLSPVSKAPVFNCHVVNPLSTGPTWEPLPLYFSEAFICWLSNQLSAWTKELQG